MPETYTQKRQRWQKLASELPHNLGERIALRTVPAVAALPEATKTTLATALDQGLAARQASKAVEILKAHPDLPVEDLLGQLDADTKVKKAETVSRHVEAQSDTPFSVWAPTSIQFDTLSALADLLQTCFPDMVRASAEALAKSPSMKPIQHLLVASRGCFDNPVMRSDVTVIVLAGLLQQITAELNDLIATHPNYQRALQTSGVDWKSTITKLRS
ncbi:MAG: hypothetical protein JW862_04955 [Anaerolineales bacterium]|nr:hypothetical protein [Anaerolineales bacterium]